VLLNRTRRLSTSDGRAAALNDGLYQERERAVERTTETHLANNPAQGKATSPTKAVASRKTACEYDVP